MVDAYCPHRRAPLFFGRNEECGLRCVYHGWKFAADGACVDLPSEPAASPMKSSIRIKAYPTVERGGVVWAYLGPHDQMPPAPDYEWTRVPETHRHVSKSYQACNYLQGLEGGLDTAHVSFLHNNKIGDRRNLYSRDGAPKIDVHETDYGYYYVSTPQGRSRSRLGARLSIHAALPADAAEHGEQRAFVQPCRAPRRRPSLGADR